MKTRNNLSSKLWGKVVGVINKPQKIVKNLNLKWKITLVIAVVILIVMYSVSLITYVYTKNLVTAEIDQKIHLVKEAQKISVNNLLRNINNQVANFATNREVINLASFLSPMVSRADADLSGILNEHRFDRIEPVMPVLLEHQKLIEGVYYLKITSPDGIVLLDTRIWEDDDEKDYEWRKWVGQGLELEPPFYKVPLLSELTFENEGAVIIFQSPIYESATNNLVGHYVLGLSLNYFVDNINQPPLEEGSMQLVNERGIIYNHENKALIGSRIRDNWLVSGIRRGESAFKGLDEELYRVVEKLDKNIALYLSFNIPEEIMNRPVNKIRNINFIVSGLGILFVFVCGHYFIARQLVPLNKIISSFSRLEKGELKEDVLLEKKNVERKDEIGILGQAFNSMVLQIKKIITSINDAAERVAGSSLHLQESSQETEYVSEQVAIIMQEVAGGASEQAKNLELVNLKIHDLAKGIENLGSFSDEMGKLAQEMSEAANTGGTEIARAGRQMESIKTSIEEVASRMNSFNAISSQIDSIVEIINNIAEQTNLLALNAAIEAARAGKAGRGFSVVAEEITKLAEESKNSASQISNLVKEIKDQTVAAGEKMVEGTIEVKSGETVVNSVKDVFTQIHGKIEQVVSGIYRSRQVVTDLHEDTEKIVENAGNVAGISQQISANTEEAAASSEEQASSSKELKLLADTLTKMAEELNELVKKFQL